MDPPLAAAIAERLLRAGFVEAAARHAPDDPDDPTLRRLRAEIALARGRPAEAERVLLGLEGPRPFGCAPAPAPCGPRCCTGTATWRS